MSPKKVRSITNNVKVLKNMCANQVYTKTLRSKINPTDKTILTPRKLKIL